MINPDYARYIAAGRARLAELDVLIAAGFDVGESNEDSAQRVPKRSGLPRGYPLREHYRASLEAVAVQMRAKYGRTDAASKSLNARLGAQ